LANLWQFAKAANWGGAYMEHTFWQKYGTFIGRDEPTFKLRIVFSLKSQALGLVSGMIYMVLTVLQAFRLMNCEASDEEISSHLSWKACF
jgi:hypothetical protein